MSHSNIMSLKTRLENLRADLKMVQLRKEAEGQASVEARTTSRSPLFGVPFALAFVFALAALFGAPASAAIDFSNISALLQAVVTLIPDFMDLVIEMAPLIVTIAIIGFILAFLDKILQMLKF